MINWWQRELIKEIKLGTQWPQCYTCTCITGASSRKGIIHRCLSFCLNSNTSESQDDEWRGENCAQCISIYTTVVCDRAARWQSGKTRLRCVAVTYYHILSTISEDFECPGTLRSYLYLAANKQCTPTVCYITSRSNKCNLFSRMKTFSLGLESNKMGRWCYWSFVQLSDSINSFTSDSCCILGSIHSLYPPALTLCSVMGG